MSNEMVDAANDNETQIHQSCGNIFRDLGCEEAATALDEFRAKGGISLDDLKTQLGL